MASDTLKEFRKMAADQLHEREKELRLELYKLRTGATVEKVKDTSQYRKIRKDIARILTIRQEQNTPKAQA